MSERFAGRYLLLRLLGEGGMGQVHLARDLTTGAECAIKRLRGGEAAESAEALHREFEALTRIRHPAVVGVRDVGVSAEGEPYLVMEYVPGLAASGVAGPGDWETACVIGAEIAGGLEALHGAGVVHGDLKPANVLVVASADAPGRIAAVRLLDFGLAALRQRVEPGHRGTAGYAAPEVVRGAAPTPAADLYGLGATLFTLLTQAPPFPGETGEEVLRAQRRGPPSAVRLENAGVPAALAELVLRLLADDPAERPESARAARRALEHVHPAARRRLADRLRTVVVVGRERELARIERWRLARSEGARLAFLQGEAGAGKSALLAEIAARAALGGDAVIALSCATLDRPGAVVRAVLRALVSGAPAGAEEAIEESVRRWMAGEEPLAEEHLEATVLAAASTAASFPHSVLVLLDEADRLERSALTWIRRVALHPYSAALQWMLARRPAAAAEEEEQLLVEAGVAVRVELAALSEDAVAQLAASRLHAAAPPALREHLVRHAGGHPGMTVELLVAAARHGAITEGEAGILVNADALPAATRATTFEDAVRERLANEDDTVRTALAALAACATPLSPEEITAVAPGVAAATIARLRAIGAVTPGEEGRLALQPPSLGDTVWNTLDAARRAEIGRRALKLALPARQRFRIARDLEDVPAALTCAEPAFAEAPDPRFAGEVAALAEARDPALAVAWHDRAAEAWRVRGRYSDVRKHAERALALGADESGRGARWVMLSTAAIRSGSAADVEEVARRALAESLTEAQRSQVLTNRAVARAQAGDREGEERDIAEALGLAESSGDALATAVVTEMIGKRRVDHRDLDGAAAMFVRAAAGYKEARNPVGIVRAGFWRARLAHEGRDVKQAEKLLMEVVPLARSLSNRGALADVLMLLAYVRLDSGRWAEAREPLEDAARINLEDGRPPDAVLAIANLAQIQGLLGRPREAYRTARVALRLCRRYRPDQFSLALRSLAQVERLRGRLSRARVAGRRALEMSATTSKDEERWCRLDLGKTLAAAGDWPAARRVWERGLARSGAEGETLSSVLLKLSGGRAALRAGDAPSARVRLDEAESWVRRHAPPLGQATLDLLRAEVAFHEHRRGDALESGQRALAILATLPAPGDRARAAFDLASLATPAAGLRDTVLEWAETAVANFERQGNHRGREQALALALQWERLAAPHAIALNARESGLLERVSWLLHSLTDLGELTRRAMQAAVEQLDAERGVLLLMDPDGGKLQPMAEHGAIEAETRNAAVRYSRRVAQQVTESGGSLLIQDAPSDPRAASPSVKDLRLRSILCVPMFLPGGRTVGAVYLDDSRRSHAFGDAERQMLEGFAQLMAVAIESSRGHEEVRREKERLEGENLSLRREIGTRMKGPGLIGTSTAMQRVMAMMEQAARSNATVLITGENGTGKELIARTLHHSGPRHGRPFIAVNCGAIPDALIEAEMFGILANVATGVRARPGHFLQANGGTLMLDEIGEAPPHAQVALLSAIANREITPVGGSKPAAVDVRMIAATNRDLRRMVEHGQFREDLFYRLSVIEIEVPSLRERKADIPALVQHFLKRFAEQQEREVPELSRDFLATLMRSDWPGNVRELQNYIERVMAMTPGRILRPVPPPRDIDPAGNMARLSRTRRLPDAVTEVELRLIREALSRAQGNQSKAARELGLTEQAVRYRLRKYRIAQARQNRRTRHN